MQDEKLQEATGEQEVNIADIFANRDSDEQEKKEVSKPEKDIQEKFDETKEPEGKKSIDEEPKKEVSTKEKDSEPDYQVELEKAERRYKESQKWGSDMRKKLTAYEKAIKKYGDEGILSTEEAQSLLDHTQFEDTPPEDETLFVKYAKIWDEGVERMREFSEDPKEIDKYVHAFQQLWRDSAPAEQDDILEEFSEFDGNKASMTRKMIKMGKDYYDETFGEVYEAGSIRNFKKKFAEKEKEYNKSIDKLKKELDKLKSKYEDYTEPTYKLPSGGSDKSIDTHNYTTDVKEIFSMR